MDELTRRRLLAATAAGGLVTAATVAGAQTGEPVPQPQRPGHGGTDPGPRNLARDRQNPDLLVPPSTDHGTLPNLRFSFSDSHVRQESGGWTRQITVRELGISKNIAGVNMRLNAGGVRELHWHKAAEWAYMLYGTARITEGGAAELLQRLARTYLGPEVRFPPMDSPPPGYITHIRVDRVSGVGPWAAQR